MQSSLSDLFEDGAAGASATAPTVAAPSAASAAALQQAMAAVEDDGDRSAAAGLQVGKCAVVPLLVFVCLPN